MWGAGCGACGVWEEGGGEAGGLQSSFVFCSMSIRDLRRGQPFFEEEQERGACAFDFGNQNSVPKLGLLPQSGEPCLFHEPLLARWTQLDRSPRFDN